MSRLTDLVAAELGAPVEPRVAAFAADIAGQYGAASRAVLFYGSCLRSDRLEGEMLDFYLIVSDYRAAYGRSWLAVANRLIPPNVFPSGHDGLQAKIAVLSEGDFARLASSRTRGVSVWARFAQPARLVWAADEAARTKAVDGVAQAAPALLKAARPMVGDRIGRRELWRQAFDLTYSAELRAERSGRSRSVVDTDPERYERFTLPALAEAGIAAEPDGEGSLVFADGLTSRARRAGKRAWRRRRIEGKLLTLLRLAKASATYAGGVDYLVWKINRHAGTNIEVRDWQRRWPLLGALVLLPRLWLRGAVR
ncbi:MAG: hypothetical protein ABR601_10720 [Parasphingopyxis sp.]|nr:hypothetical protein [Sphingomonadales bacterium]